MPDVMYRKWRPQSWESIIGQDHVTHTLRNAMLAGRMSHAYLFAGPRGTGKTTTARVLAKALNCLDPDPENRPCNTCLHCQALVEGRFLDLIEIDAASMTGVDHIRDLRDKINFVPNQGKYKIYIIDEVHMLSTSAFNALLKTLEEPPSHAVFVLATTEVHKIPATVLSRCQRHEFRRISVGEIVRYLSRIARSESIQVEPEALTLIARQSTGSMRDAISLLDQLASNNERITLEMTQTVLGTAPSQAVIEIVESLLSNLPAQGLDQIHDALDRGSDPRQFARQVVDYLRGLLLISMGNPDQIDVTADIRARMEQHAQRFNSQQLLDVIRMFNNATLGTRGLWQPALPLEMAFIEALQVSNPSMAVPSRFTPAAGPSPEPVQAASPDPSSPTSQDAGVSQQSYAPGRAQVEPATVDGSPFAQHLARGWPQLMSNLRSNNEQAYRLLSSIKSRYIRGNCLVLGFTSEIFHSQFIEEQNINAIQHELRQVFGRDIPVTCRLEGTGQEEIPADLGDESIVKTALRDLGGKLVDAQQNDDI